MSEENRRWLLARRPQGMVREDDFALHEAAADLAGWVADGSIAWEADVQHGLENAPAALQRLSTGRSFGRQLLER